MERDSQLVEKKPDVDIKNAIIADMILHHLSDMIFVMKVDEDEKFRYYFINLAGQRMSGLDESDLGKCFEDVLTAERSAHYTLYYNRACHVKEPVVFIDEVVTEDRVTNVYEAKLTPICNEWGEVEYIMCVTKIIHTNEVETIKYVELHDQLTGVWNRKALMDHLPMEIAATLPANGEFALVAIDLDRFKQINDTLGFYSGDQLLKLVAARLMESNKPGKRLYRLGSDEFVFLITEVNQKEAEEHVQAIIALFEKPFLISKEECFITPSVGISMFPSDGKDADTLLKSAQNALFLVKEQGRGDYKFYRSSMGNTLSNYVLMEAHLRRAIEKNELKLHYQPQVNLRTGEIESFEALLRWHNRKFGAVSPADFIPVAEETGLIIPIGEWVIKTACRQLAEWRQKGYENIRIAINISPRQFSQWDLPDFILSSLKEYKLSASALEIEITEGAMHDRDSALQTLERLKGMGVILSVDDFGTGYSSLNYLKKFPIDILKIDQSFVKEIKHDDKDAAITKTIIHLAHSLGMDVVAEGVEEEVQVNFLAEANCEKAQGFYFSKPVDANEIEQSILRKNMKVSKMPIT